VRPQNVRRIGALVAAGTLSAAAGIATPVLARADNSTATTRAVAVDHRTRVSSVDEQAASPGIASDRERSVTAAREGDIHAVGWWSCFVDYNFGQQFWTRVLYVSTGSNPSQPTNLVCYADAGKIKVSDGAANAWYSGNNAGKFTWRKGDHGKTHVTKFKKHDHGDLPKGVKILTLRIY
jgi:hypothetical protein